jgi:flagellar motor switch protein FliG
MTVSKLNAADKAALVLWALGDEIAPEILKRLGAEQSKQIIASLGRFGRIPSELVEQTLTEFQTLLESPVGSAPDGRDFLKKIARAAFQGEQAEHIIEFADSNMQEMSALKNADSDRLAKFLLDEHPQTRAAILAHAPTALAADTLKLLPGEIQIDTIIRMASLSSIDREIIMEINQSLTEFLNSSQHLKTNLGGSDKVAAMLRAVDNDTRKTLLENLDSRDHLTADSIRKKLFTFDDIVRIDPKGFQKLLTAIVHQNLLLAIRQCSPATTDFIMRNMSEQRRVLLKDDLAAMSPQRMEDIAAAQESIIQLVDEWVEDGKLEIRDPNERYV